MSEKRYDAPMNLHRGFAHSEDYLRGVADGLAAARGESPAPRTDGAETLGREDAAKLEWEKRANLPPWERQAQASGAEKRGEPPKKLSEEEARAIERANLNRPIWERQGQGNK